MITASQILSVSDEIARKFRPERIILFGSYAYGTPTEDSDVDLLVVMPFEGKSVRKSIEIKAEVHQGFPMDLIAITPKRLTERLDSGDYFLCEVVKGGRVLYEVQHPRVGDATDESEANDAVTLCRGVRGTLRQGLGLPG